MKNITNILFLIAGITIGSIAVQVYNKSKQPMSWYFMRDPYLTTSREPTVYRGDAPHQWVIYFERPEHGDRAVR